MNIDIRHQEQRHQEQIEQIELSRPTRTERNRQNRDDRWNRDKQIDIPSVKRGEAKPLAEKTS